MPDTRHAMDVIVAIGTPIGAGSRSLIRISGNGVFDTLASVMRGPAASLLGSSTRGLAVGRLRIPLSLGGIASGEDLPVLVAIAPGPASFTGEDVIEMQVPGHPALASTVRDRLIEAFDAAGVPARSAGPGEFSARAFLAGRLDAADATAIALAIEATRDDDLDGIERLRREDWGTAIGSIRGELISVAARLEAGIDFTDEEDVVACTAEECRRSLAAARAAIDGLDTTLGAMAGEASDLPRVVLTGPPNAGKSTLFNVLCGEDRVVVSPTAGTTRDAIEAVVTLTRELRGEEIRCVLVDTAGVGDATADVLESDAVATATRAVHSADVVVRCRSADDDRGPVARADGAAAVIDVVTKGDLGQGRTVHITPDEDHAALRISSITGDGLPALKIRIADAVGEVTGSDVRRSLLERLRRGLRQARTCLDEATELMHTADATAAVPGPELVAATIHAALEELALLDGTLDPDRVLDEVFGRFCVGK